MAFSRCSGHKTHYQVHGVRVLCYCCHAVKTPIEVRADSSSLDFFWTKFWFFQDYFNYIGMSDAGHEFLRKLDKSNQLSAEEAAKGIIKVLEIVSNVF